MADYQADLLRLIDELTAIVSETAMVSESGPSLPLLASALDVRNNFAEWRSILQPGYVETYEIEPVIYEIEPIIQEQAALATDAHRRGDAWSAVDRAIDLNNTLANSVLSTLPGAPLILPKPRRR